MKRDSKIQIFIYIFCTTISLMSLYFDSAAMKLIQVVPWCFAFLYFLVSADTSGLKNISKFTCLYGMWLLVVMIMSCITWIVHLSESQYISRGFQKLFFQVFTLIIIFFACYMFREKAILYSFYAACIFNSICILLAVKQTGISQSIADFKYFLTSGFDAMGCMKLLELSDGTYPFAFFLLYFIFRYPKSKKKYICCAFCLLFLFTGMKRISIIAILVACIVGHLLKKIKEESLYRLIPIFGIGTIIFGFFYIVLVRYDVFSLIMNMMNVNTMGRNELYDLVHDYYSISPLFIGNGYEFITTLFKSIGRLNGLNLGKIQALHNSFLTTYLEVGFFGFIFWLWNGFWLIPNYIKKHYNNEFLIIFYVEAVFILITYVTDNTAFVFFSSMAYRLVHVAMASEESNEKFNEIDELSVNGR